MATWRLCLIVVVGILFFTSPLQVFSQNNAPGAAAPQANPAWAKLTDANDIVGVLDSGAGTVKVIVNLLPPAKKLAATNWDSPTSLQALQARIASLQQPVLNSLAAGDFALRHRFENQAGFSGEVTRKGLEQLANDPRVASIEPVRVFEPHLAQGIPLMNAAVYRSTYNGSGVSIAICDSGVDYTHPRLGGGGFPNTKVLGGYDYGDNDANPIPNGTAHGTCCAGIAAGDLGTVGDYIGGVAPNAKIYALKVTYGTGGSAYNDAIINAWNWCVTHKNDNPNYPILVISLSMGGSKYTSYCDSSNSSFATAANNAVAAGITVLASAGNNGYCNALASPACLSNVVSVGAVYDASFGTYYPCLGYDACAIKYSTTGCSTGYYAIDGTYADRVTSYSNAASFLSVLAPSNQAYTTDIVGSSGYSTGDYYSGFGGTSAACPYAAGAVACLQSAAKATTGLYLPPADVRAILESTGDSVTDPKVAITKPRVNLGHAIGGIGSFYCAGAGGCDEYISGVQVGTINNTGTTCNGYADYTNLSTSIRRGQSLAVTVTNGRPYAGDQCAIWVDWNHNESLDDAGEMIAMSGSPGGGPYTTTITAPANARFGEARLRVRLTYTGAVDPCGTTVYGETEDYTLRVLAAADFNGDGSVDGTDYGLFATCFNGTGKSIAPACLVTDLDGDHDVDGVDFGLFAGCFNGSGNPPACL